VGVPLKTCGAALIRVLVSNLVAPHSYQQIFQSAWHSPTACWCVLLFVLVVQVSGEREFFGHMVVDAVTKLDPATLDLRMLGIKKVQVRGASGCYSNSGLA